MSKLLGAPAAIETVRQLKKAVTETASREEEIDRTHRLEVARAKRECEEATEAYGAELETALATEQANYEQSNQGELARHAARAARIAAAFGNSSTRVLSSVEGEKGRKIGQVQSLTLEAKRQTEANIAAAKQQLADLENQLRSDRAAFNKLKARSKAVFRGFPLLTRAFNRKVDKESLGGGTEPADIMALEGRVRDHLHKVKDELRGFRGKLLPALFRFLPLQWLVPIAIAAIATIGAIAGWDASKYTTVGGITAAVAVVLLIIQRIAAKTAAEPAGRVADALHGAATAFATCRAESEPWLTAKSEQLKSELEEKIETLNSDLGSVIKDADAIGETEPERLAKQEQRLSKRAAERHTALLASVESGHASTEATLRSDHDAKTTAAATERDRLIAEAEAKHTASWETLVADWRASVDPIYQTFAEQNEAISATFPAWDDGWTGSWRAPADFAHAAPFGRLAVDVEALAEALPESDKLSLPGGEKNIDVPLATTFPDHGNVLFETESSGDPALIGAFNNLIFRLLSVAPPGKLSFSIVDPVGLGQNFASVTHLADYEDSIINKRIWTAREQIEARITELTEHMEKVIQMYLRNEYETITEYNLKAGNIAEKYHYLVVADFPTNFSEQAIRGLLKIAASGARCGIYTIVHWDKRATMPEAFLPEEMHKTSLVIEGTKSGKFRFAERFKAGTTLTFDPAPSDAVATEFVKKIGDASDDSNRVEVPFSQIMPPGGELWTGDSTKELSVPIGRSGATKLQNLSFGKGTRQHALIAGKTGSGKSTLFHVVITNLALHFSPDEVEFYLVDFKKGVEFKAYGNKKLPHAKVIAIESDREFGLSVLQRLDEELKRRGEMFRELGAQDVAGFKKAGGGTMPRTLLMIDEFQEYFVEDDKIAQQASVLLDRIVRQGRAFGIHVFLGSQTLGGAYSLARATLGQMVIRIALMCNEADAYLIMDEGNPAPRLLTRPGEGIYNDGAGAVENNSPFQTVWLPEDERDAHLDSVNALLAERGHDPGNPIVFEGNAPADISENLLLTKLRKAEPASPPSPKIWLGAPNAIKGPTEATFHRQSGNHLLVVGQRDDAVLAMMGISLVTLSAQYPADGAKFVVIDGSPPGSTEREFLDSVAKTLPQDVATTSEKDVGELVGEIAAEMKARADSSDAAAAPPIFVFINGVQKYKKLRYDEDLAYSFDASATEGNPAIQINEIITEGAALGIHLLTSVDSYNNLVRSLSRKALGEFEMRILFQMSANDSAALVDSTKAGNLGMHRALFYNEHEGYLETFRPYAQPTSTWVAGG